MKNLAGIMILTAILSGCGGGEKTVTMTSNEHANSKPRNDMGITLLDFQDQTTPIEASDIAFEINGIGEFFNKIDLGGVKDADDGEKDCFANLFADKTFKDSGDDFYVLSSSNMDLNRCFSNNSDIFEDYFSNTYIELALVDRFGNAIDLEGLTQFASFDSYQDGLFTHEFIQMEGGATILQLGSSLDFSFTYLTAATSDASKPCEIDPLERIKDDCTYHSKLVVEHAGQAPNVTTASLTFNNIKITPGASYFSGGTISFSINNWDGVMTYHPTDPQRAPTYFATNGTDTVTGTLGDEE